MKINEFLKKQIKAGMKQKEIAEKIGMPIASFNKIILGRKPKLETIQKIARAFEVPLSELIDDTEGRVLTLKEKILLDMIDGDQELLCDAIKHIEKEKFFKKMTMAA